MKQSICKTFDSQVEYIHIYHMRDKNVKSSDNSICKQFELMKNNLDIRFQSIQVYNLLHNYHCEPNVFNS